MVQKPWGGGGIGCEVLGMLLLTVHGALGVWEFSVDRAAWGVYGGC